MLIEIDETLKVVFIHPYLDISADHKEQRSKSLEKQDTGIAKNH
jgi:hypothetical protein